MAKIQLDVELPDALIKSFVQHFRDWDMQHSKDVQLKFWIPESKLTGDEMLAIFRSIKPPFPHYWKIPGGMDN